ncbi:SigE family RNA polymerase sigma factor [Actinotalea sp. K2]|uniref:SigE family RNA polymerase sigma factor n=1 Tax=Actinotalea sp. K2 TaxID=2939438 RepID=UPI002016D359|nr:SigE family RNA polymerase sigma factor [Actinotalea sp. K2]MCL3862518.1 SigE family RNA polymerase sigma factor [Actinotalea sp. K2]
MSGVPVGVEDGPILAEEQVVDRVAGSSRSWLTRDEEFSAFMVEAEPLLSRTAWLLCGDTHRAEELVQQTLVRTYVAWPRARATDPLAYARRTLANGRIDLWRRRRRELLVAPEDMAEPSRPGAQGGADGSGQHQHAERDALVRALAQLSPQRRRVVVLRYVLDLSERQVADDLNISVGAVKSAAARGLRQLREVLGEVDGLAGARVEEE